MGRLRSDAATTDSMPTVSCFSRQDHLKSRGEKWKLEKVWIFLQQNIT